ncbi:MAG: ABC transporter ATP-binding protein [Verrucomicrobia bacterium]|nr:ABC transporter ATP-binding protein [Verrucomicrobiota bacterium]
MTYSELFRFLWTFVRRQKWTFFFVYLLDALAWPMEALALPWILGQTVDVFIHFEADRMGAFQSLLPLIYLGIGIYLFIELASRTMGFLIGKGIPKLQADIRMEMFDHVERHSPHYFNERFAGNLANKISDASTLVEQIAQHLFWPLVPTLVVVIASCTILWWIHPLFACFLGSWVLVSFSLVILFSRRIDTYATHHEEVKSTLLGKIVDSLTNNFAVNLFYRFSYERKALNPYQQDEEKTNRKTRWFTEKMNCYFSAYFIVGNFLLLNGSLIYFWLHDQITTAQTVQVFNSLFNVTSGIWMTCGILPSFFSSLGSLKQAFSVMQDEQDIGDTCHAKKLSVQSGEIVFNQVSFAYHEKDLFTDLHLHIRSGEKVGIVGFTGAGKSTFINLILRFYPLRKGSILIDDQDTANVTLESLRQNIALIPQDPVLFHRSLKDNIAYGNLDATEAEIIHAAKLAHCDEFIRNIPGGYEAKVGERGTKLSGGEKQRIAIARAILANSPILILDEATSSLDSVTERYIQDSLHTLMQNKTAIVVAHRLSTLLRMDRILVFENGRIVESGTHDELLHKKQHYFRMWNMQIGGFLPDKS